MQSLSQSQPSCTAFYAHLFNDIPVILAKFGQEPITVYSHTYKPILFYSSDLDASLTILGAMDMADTQALLDRMHGWYVAIACSRPN